MPRLALALALLSWLLAQPARGQESTEAPEFEARLCALDSACCHYDGDDRTRRVERHRLDRRGTLLLLECSTFGYNGEWSPFVLSRDGEIRVASFEGAATSELFPPRTEGPPWLISAWFRNGHLVSTYCHRQICDSGSQVEYSWTGRAFRRALVRSRVDDYAGRDGVGPWPIAWPAARRCDYRWSVDDAGTPTLLALVRRRRREHTIRAPDDTCEAPGDHSILHCHGVHYPVTADGDDWVVWRDAAEEGTYRELTRVRRRCRL